MYSLRGPLKRAEIGPSLRAILLRGGRFEIRGAKLENDRVVMESGGGQIGLFIELNGPVWMSF